MKNQKYLKKISTELNNELIEKYNFFSNSGIVYIPKDKEEKKFKNYVKKIFKPERFTYNSFTMKEAYLEDNISSAISLDISLYIIPKTNIMTTIFGFEYNDYGTKAGMNPNFDIDDTNSIEIGLEKCLEMQLNVYNELFIGSVVNKFLEYIGENELTIKIE